MALSSAVCQHILYSTYRIHIPSNRTVNRFDKNRPLTDLVRDENTCLTGIEIGIQNSWSGSCMAGKGEEVGDIGRCTGKSA